MQSKMNGGEEARRECPQCHSKRNWKDGVRETSNGFVQRFICRDCWHRFTESSVLSTNQNISLERQVCATLIGAKNLASATETKTVAGEEKTQLDARIIQYEWKCKKRQLSPDTISKRRGHLTRLLKDGADLDNPESVEITLASKEYPTPTKWLLVNTYRSYCKAFNIEWEPVRIKYQPQMPYIPTEEECKLFIVALPKVLGVFCRALFETGARRGEMAKLEWTDIDAENCTIAIRHPEKGSNPRVNKVTRECMNLLMSLPKKNGINVFNPRPTGYDPNFNRQRTKIAAKLQKPQLLKIHFHTFRHLRGTLDIHNHVPLFEVKERLGHRCISNTEKYVHWNRQLYNEKSDRYYFAAVSTIEQAQKLIETGYEYVTDMEGMKLFRKAK